MLSQRDASFMHAVFMFDSDVTSTTACARAGNDTQSDRTLGCEEQRENRARYKENGESGSARKETATKMKVLTSQKCSLKNILR